jgi:hypothetical protein
MRRAVIDGDQTSKEDRKQHYGLKAYQGLPARGNRVGRHMTSDRCGSDLSRLTVKLRGRTSAPNGAEGAQSLSARGANPQAHHGPLERLLEGAALNTLRALRRREQNEQRSQVEHSPA